MLVQDHYHGCGVYFGKDKAGSFYSLYSFVTHAVNPLGIASMYNCSDIFTNLLKCSKMTSIPPSI
jgi:hypothetical protein